MATLAASAGGSSATGGSAAALALRQASASGSTDSGGSAAGVEMIAFSPWAVEASQRSTIGFSGRGLLALSVPVVPPPAGEPYVKMVDPNVSDPALDGFGRPVEWAVDPLVSDWGRLRMVIGGVDVTYFRGVPLQLESWSEAEPFDDGPASVSFPQVSCFEDLGSEALQWAAAGSVATLEVVRPDGTRSTLWDGEVASREVSEAGLGLHLLGSMWRLDLQKAPPPLWSGDTATDIGETIAGIVDAACDRYGFRVPFAHTLTGIKQTGRASWQGKLSYIGELLAQAYIAGAPDPGSTVPRATRPAASVVGMARRVQGGYWLGGSDGGVFAFNGVSGPVERIPYYGSMAGRPLTWPMTGFEGRPQGDGYWFVALDGGVFAFGAAAFLGNAIGLSPYQLVDIVSTPSGNGYWLVSWVGDVYAFGDAGYHGGTPALGGGATIVAMAATPSGNGYWLMSNFGDVYAYGDALYAGGSTDVGAQFTTIGAAPGGGYWCCTDDGRTYPHGGPTLSTLPPGPLGGKIVDIAVYRDDAYILCGADGGVFVWGGGMAYCGSIPGGDAQTYKWTMRRNRATGVAELAIVDMWTRHWFVTAGAPGVKIAMSWDATMAVNVVYGEGVNPPDHVSHKTAASVWRNSRYPGLRTDAAPVFDGTVMAPGFTGPQWQLFAKEAASKGWAIDDTATYAPEARSVVRAIQQAAGLTVSGEVGAQTWASVFDVGSNGGDLTGAYFAPLAVDPKVERYLYTASGAATGSNPSWDRNALRVERHNNYGSDVTKAQGQLAAASELARDRVPSWTGTITLTTDPEDGSRFEIHAGQNVTLRAFGGMVFGLFLHVVSVERNWASGEVALTVSERAKDAMTLADMRSRDRATFDPARNGAPPRTVQSLVEDSMAVFDAEAGAGIVPYHATQRGQWNVLRVPFGSWGNIVLTHFGLVVPARYSIAVFDRPITPQQLQAIIPDPVNDSWLPLQISGNPSYGDYVNAWGFMMGWGGSPAGTVDMCGFYGGDDAGLESLGSPLTGVFLDRGTWPWQSTQPPWMWVAIQVVDGPDTNYIQGSFSPAPPGP